MTGPSVANVFRLGGPSTLGAPAHWPPLLGLLMQPSGPHPCGLNATAYPVVASCRCDPAFGLMPLVPLTRNPVPMLCRCRCQGHLLYMINAPYGKHLFTHAIYTTFTPLYTTYTLQPLNLLGTCTLPLSTTLPSSTYTYTYIHYLYTYTYLPLHIHA